MPVFISYSHSDKDFVDNFAIQLVREKVNVWVDRWELHVGDSLISKVQDAISGASALLVILSKASVDSEWCKKELNSALIRELEEKRVVILPILIEDCDIPLFLKEKMFADFRSNFDDGLRTTLESIAKVTNEAQGRIDEPEWHVDWAIDWKNIDEILHIQLTLVEQTEEQPYSVLSIIEIIANEDASKLYKNMDNNGDGEKGRRNIVGILAEAIKNGLELSILLEDQFEKGVVVELRDKDSSAQYLARVSTRRMGEDTGRDVLVHVGNQIIQIHQHMGEVAVGGK